MLDTYCIVVLQYSMPTISNKETALLMLLSEEPMHAYQIEKVVENRDMRFWTEISMSSIYKLLRKLAGEKFITKHREDTDNGITKNVFSLTAKGRRALADRITEIITEPEHMKWRMDLATSHLDVLPRHEALRCLAEYRTKLIEGIESYHQLDKYLGEEDCPLPSRALARRPQFLLQGEIEWLDGYVKELEEGTSNG